MPTYKLRHSHSMLAAPCGHCSSLFAAVLSTEGQNEENWIDRSYTVVLTCMRCGHSGTSGLNKDGIVANRLALTDYGAYTYDTDEYPDPSVGEADNA